jgi:hypothetical protein
VTGITAAALAAVLAKFSVVGLFLGFPGFVATVPVFGMHGGEGYEVTAYWIIINSFFYGGVIFLLLTPRRRQHI